MIIFLNRGVFKLKKSMVSLISSLLCVFLVIPTVSIFAADTSRTVVISEVIGTVEVKKAGGKRALKAFKNMNLNQGDEITTGKDSSATLIFSNGSNEDDKLVLDAETTISLTKTTSKKIQ